MVVGLLIGLLSLGAFLTAWLITNRPTGGQREINANHHGLYLLVNDLVTLQDRGYQPVFPDVETTARARALLAGYEQQLVAMPPRLPAGPVDRPLTSE